MIGGVTKLSIKGDRDDKVEDIKTGPGSAKGVCAFEFVKRLA